MGSAVSEHLVRGKQIFSPWHLDILALPWKLTEPHHREDFKRWKQLAKSRPGVVSSVPLCSFTWDCGLELGKIETPNLCRETQTPQECLSKSLMLNEYLWVWEMCCHQQGHFSPMLSPALMKKKIRKASYRKALMVLLSLVKDFQGSTCQTLRGTHC